jgi:acetyltransferase-like isoleucine patch superfamily enzyme
MSHAPTRLLGRVVRVPHLASQGHPFYTTGRTIREQPHLLAPVQVGDGVRIGAGAVIAAGAVGIRDVAAFQVVGGVPGRLLRERPRDNRRPAGQTP